MIIPSIFVKLLTSLNIKSSLPSAKLSGILPNISCKECLKIHSYYSLHFLHFLMECVLGTELKFGITEKVVEIYRLWFIETWRSFSIFLVFYSCQFALLLSFPSLPSPGLVLSFGFKETPKSKQNGQNCWLLFCNLF